MKKNQAASTNSLGNEVNKKILETDYPRGRAIEVFRRTDSYRYHFNLGTKNRPESFLDYILPYPELRKNSSDLSEGKVNRKPCLAVGELFRLKCQVWNCSIKVSELYTDFYTKEEFTDRFVKLNAVSKEFIDRDSKSPLISVKIIELNRQTLPLYKRLDDKNKSLIQN